MIADIPSREEPALDAMSALELWRAHLATQPVYSWMSPGRNRAGIQIEAIGTPNVPEAERLLAREQIVAHERTAPERVDSKTFDPSASVVEFDAARDAYRRACQEYLDRLDKLRDIAYGYRFHVMETEGAHFSHATPRGSGYSWEEALAAAGVQL